MPVVWQRFRGEHRNWLLELSEVRPVVGRFLPVGALFCLILGPETLF